MPSLLDLDLDNPAATLGLLGDSATAPGGAGLLDTGDAPRITQPDDRTVSSGEALARAAAEASDAVRAPFATDPTKALLARIMSNPIGAERFGEQSLTNQRGPFDPIVDPSIARWPGRPMTQSEYDAVKEGSIDLFGQLSQIAGAEGGEGPGADATVMAPARRVRPPGSPPPPPMPSPPAAPAATLTDLAIGQRGMAAVPSLRGMTPADAAVVASSEPHIIPTTKPNGEPGFVGAPDWVKTPADIQTMRNRFDDKVDAGVAGRDWYNQTRGWATDITGTKFDPITGAPTLGDPNEARRLAEGLAVFSPQSNPDTNLQFYLQARNAYLSGNPQELVRTGQQATKFNTGMAAKDAARAAGEPEPDIRQGPKTEPFAWQMSPDRPVATTGVNDIWHARSFGYTNPDGSEFDGSPTVQQHKFMDYETVLGVNRANDRASGGFTDWDAGRVQAAPWTAMKEESLARRYPSWTPAEVRAEALRTFPDLTGSAAYMTHEQMPGASTGLLGMASDVPNFSKQATWRDPNTGQDMLTAPLFHQLPMADATGTYTNSQGLLEINPAEVAQPMVDFLKKAKGNDPREIAPWTQSALGAANNVRGLTDFQEGTPAHYIDTSDALRTSEASSMRLLGDRPTPQQLAALNDVAQRNGYFVSDTGDGVSLLHAGEPNSPANGIELKQRLKAGLADEINQAMPSGTRIVPGHAWSNYADLSDELAQSVAGQGQATTKVLGSLKSLETAAPGYYDRLVNNPNVAVKAQKNLDRLTPDMRAARPDYVQLLQIMSQGGLPALLKRVGGPLGAAGLPAALAAFAPSGPQPQPQPQPQSSLLR